MCKFHNVRKKNPEETAQNLKCLLWYKQAQLAQDSTLRNPNKEESNSAITLISVRVHKLQPLEKI